MIQNYCEIIFLDCILPTPHPKKTKNKTNKQKNSLWFCLWSYFNTACRDQMSQGKESGARTHLECSVSRRRRAPGRRDTHRCTWESVYWFVEQEDTCSYSRHFHLFLHTSLYLFIWNKYQNNNMNKAFKFAFINNFSYWISLMWKWFQSTEDLLTWELNELMVDYDILRIVQVAGERHHVRATKFVCAINCLIFTICPKDPILQRWQQKF